VCWAAFSGIRMTARRLLVFLALCLMPLPAASAPDIEGFTLENGLEVIVIPNQRIPAVSHMVWYRIGAADDPPGKSGIAHFHEHMMFEGTAKYKAGEYADIIAREGGEQNAFTGRDATSYYVNITRDKLPLVMEMEADRMRGLTPADDAVEKEKQVIIEERRMRIENNPEALLAEQMNATLFRHHPYHLPVIGWMQEMEKLTGPDVLKFHETWYHPNNALLIVSGDITSAELKPLAQKYYGGLPKGKIPARRWNEEPPQIAARRVIMHHGNVRQPQWIRTYAAGSVAYGKKEQALPLLVLSQLLGNGKTSRLYQSLVVEQKLASGVDTGYDCFTLGPSVFHIKAIPEQGVDPAVLERAIDAELKRLLESGVSEDEFKRAKTLLKAESIYARDGLTSMARIMGWLRIAGLPRDYFNRWPEMIEEVTAAQIAEAARDVLQMRQSVTGLLLPEEKAAEKTP
jgi:zinc protease